MRRRVLAFVEVALGLLLVPLLVHAQRTGSAGHIGAASHSTPSFSSGPRSFAAPSRSLSQPGHWPETQIPQRERRPAGSYHHPDGRAGMGYRAHHPYAYVGYPGLLSFGYGLPLPYGVPYGSALEDDSPAQAAPQPPDYGNGPLDDIHPEVAENARLAFRPAYQGQGEEAPVHPQPATTLVFNDGRPSMMVKNYALTGHTLYALDGETRQEIPLSVLNVPATVEANRKAGVDFALPVSH